MMRSGSSAPSGFVCFLGGLLLWGLCGFSLAQITLDGSLGPRMSLPGPDVRIPAAVGQVRGPNLFHSFGEFNVPTGWSATFTGPNTITNILGRVTGGHPSHIDGLMQSQIPGANLFLLNPSGVLFGPNALLDVQGSFHVSTADYLRLADGARFFARLSDTSVLSMAPPEAFGFLGPIPAPILIRGSILTIPEGQTFSVVGGEVQVVGGILVAPSGRINIASIASPGEVRLAGTGLDVGSFTQLGDMRISDGIMDTSGPGGGTVLIRGGRLVIDNASISVETQGAIDGGGIDIAVRYLTLAGGSQLSSKTVGTGRGGTITVTATEALTMAGHDPDNIASGLFSDTTGPGAAGAVVVHAGRITMREEATIASNTHGAGPGGSVSIHATSLEVDQGFIQAQAAATSVGDAGTIAVSAGRVTLTGGAQISSSTRGAGQAGTVTVHATEALTIVGRNADGTPSGLFSSTTGPGAAGAVMVEAGRITMREGGAIASDAFGAGPGGRVTINTASLEMDSGLIEAQTAEGSLGDAGAIAVTAGNVTLTGGARINSTTLGAGRGGSITVTTTDAITISGNTSGLFTNTTGQGLGGDIAVQARQLQLTDGAVIAAESTGTGNAGSLTLAASDTVLLRGHSAITTAASQATGGNIRVTASSLVRLQDSQLTATVGGGTGDGGNVTIDPEFIVLQGSQITANAFAGHGGRISLTASKAFLADPSSTVTASSTLGINGEVNIQAPVTNISGTLVPLPQAFARATALLSTRCAERLREGKISSLVMLGRDGVPDRPGGVLPIPLALTPPEAADAAGTPGPPEATGASRVGVLHLDAHGQAQVRGWQGQGFVPAVLALECTK